MMRNERENKEAIEENIVKDFYWVVPGGLRESRKSRFKQYSKDRKEKEILSVQQKGVYERKNLGLKKGEKIKGLHKIEGRMASIEKILQGKVRKHYQIVRNINLKGGFRTEISI